MSRSSLVVLSALWLLGVGCSPSGDRSGAAAIVWYTLPDGTRFSSEQLVRFEDAADAAGKAYADGDYAACVEHFDDATALYAGNDRIWYDLACCQALDGRTDAALASLERAVELGRGGVDWLERDGDLDSLRERPAFATLIERATTLEATVAARDPLATEVDPGGPWESLEAIRAAFAKVPREPLASVLGTAETQRRIHRFRSRHVAALRAFITAHPDDVAARHAEIEALDAFDPSTPQAAAAIERFAAEFGDGPWRGAVVVRQAIQPYDEEVFWEPEHPDHETAYAAVVTVAREVVEVYPDGPGSRDAWFWLLRDGLRRHDADTVRVAYAALESHWADDARFWKTQGYHLSVARFVAQGVPEFEASTLDGETISSASLQGQVVLLDFWATWCGPCIDQLPDLKAVYAEHHDAGFEIVGISADLVGRLDEAAFRRWIADESMPWPQIYTGGGFDQPLYRDFGIEGIPTTILLDREGRVAGVDLHGDALRDTVAALL